MEDRDRPDHHSKSPFDRSTTGRAVVSSLLAGAVAAAVTVVVIAILAFGLFTSEIGLLLVAGAALAVGFVAAGIRYLVRTVDQ